MPENSDQKISPEPVSEPVSDVAQDDVTPEGAHEETSRRTKAALLKAGALQKAILTSANFSFIATDASGVIWIFNIGAEHMLGYSATEVLNRFTPAEISDPQELIVRAAALSAEFGESITPGFEALVYKASRGIEDIYGLTYIRKDGSRFPAIVSVTALRDVRNEIIGYLLIGTDNTVRKQIEEDQQKLSQSLRDNQFYTRSLFESNVDAIMTTDPAGIITDVNRQMEKLTACTRDELIGAPFKKFFTNPDLAEAGIKLALIKKEITNYELVVRARNGKLIEVSFNATTFHDRDRKLQGVFAAARDITERKLLDLVLQEKNKELESARLAADKANLAKSEFLSSMSHELRSPLNAILGFAQLMESDSTTQSPTQKDGAAQILKAGWHLLKLINEILDLAKVESGQITMSREPVSLAEVLLECQAMVEPQALEHGIRLTFPTFSSPIFVRADRTRLMQVLVNLLTNAIKYNIEEGTVEVTCSEGGDGRVRTSIMDSGVGLSPEQLQQLFKPFNRLGQDEGSEQGTGIGLVVAKRLVELMRGVIGVESVVGKGSVFWFELPSSAEPELVGTNDAPVNDAPELVGSNKAPASVKPQKVYKLRPCTLLYVEDNPANLQLVEQIIARCPEVKLLSAENGERGIEVARQSLPEAIMMDINLPGMSGIEALRILRDDPLTAHIPVIAISADAMRLDVERGLKAGFFRYLTKPIKVDELMEALNLALEQRQSAAKETTA